LLRGPEAQQKTAESQSKIAILLTIHAAVAIMNGTASLDGRGLENGAADLAMRQGSQWEQKLPLNQTDHSPVSLNTEAVGKA
jgi:hypothetical protein